MLHPQDAPERDELRARFTLWLETVVKHAKIDYVRKLKRQPNIVSLDEIPEEALISKESEEQWLQVLRDPTPYDFEEERLAKAFMALPLKRRLVMELLFIEELSESETAKRLNCSTQYVRNQKCVALKKLRTLLMKGGDDD